MASIHTVTLFADGGSRGNPGPAGSGAVLYDSEGKEIAALKKFLGKTTNNVAEYTAVVIGLEHAKQLGAKRVNAFLDSQLVVRQMTGEYRVRQPHLQTLYLKIQALCTDFEQVSFNHVRRERNARADELANEAMDQGMKQ